MQHQYTPQPHDPTEAIQAYLGCRTRAEQQLRDARAAEDRQMAQFWIDNAERQLLRWQAVVDRQVRP